MITTFLFDLGGVVFTNGTKIFIENLAKKYQLDENELREVSDGALGSDYREGKISRDEFWKQFLEITKIPEHADVLEDEWIRSYGLILGTVEIIQTLKKKYSIFYLSDNVKERVDALNKNFDFLRLFDGGIFSHEVGARKPDPKIYEMAISKLQIKPEETVFIDDKPSSLPPAQSIGMKVLLFTTPNQFLIDLGRFGLSV